MDEVDGQKMEEIVQKAEKYLSQNPNTASIMMPERPQEPLPQDCCGSSCRPCVFDIYRRDTYLWAKDCLISAGLLEESHFHGASELEETVLSTAEFRRFELVSIQEITEDSRIYRFSLPKNSSLGLPIGKHIVLRGRNKQGKTITRQYTPISERDTKGYFDVLVKLYQYGQMSHHWRTLEVGQFCKFRGPLGKFSLRRNQYRTMMMLAAGTGIAPMAQIIQAVLSDEEEETRIRLLYSSRTYKDILLKHLINDWSRHWNFTVKHFLSQDENAEQCGFMEDIVFGRKIDEETLRTELAPYFDKENLDLDPDLSSIIFVCGTKSYDKDVMNFIRQALGYQALDCNRIYRF